MNKLSHKVKRVQSKPASVSIKEQLLRSSHKTTPVAVKDVSFNIGMLKKLFVSGVMER